MPRASTSSRRKRATRPKRVQREARPEAIEDALRRMEEKLEAMEARLSSLERRVAPVVGTDVGPTCCSDDIIGCLDDCSVDVKELRKKVRNARSPTRGR